MKLQVRTTFDFGKLANKIEGIMNDVVDDGKRLYRATTRDNLKEGNLRKLRPASIEARKRGHYWKGKKVAPTNSTKPLIYTGSLLNSIKWKDDGVEMNEYGLFHQKGFLMRTGALVKPRRFLHLSLMANEFQALSMVRNTINLLIKCIKELARHLKSNGR